MAQPLLFVQDMDHNQEINPGVDRDPVDFTSAREREEAIERSAAYTGRLIRGAESESRAELAEAASAILREEALGGVASVDRPLATDARTRPVNPLGAGIGIIVLGAAISLLLPFVGISMMALGVAALLWGLVISIRRR